MGEVTDEVLSHFSKFDLNGDGSIDRFELMHVLKLLNDGVWTDAAVERLMAKFDANNNGKIELEEFVHWIFQTPMLECRCGYTCGTRKAFDRHIARFADEPGGREAHGVPCPLSKLAEELGSPKHGGRSLQLDILEDGAATALPVSPSAGSKCKSVKLPEEAVESSESCKSLTKSLSSTLSASDLSPQPCLTPCPTPVARRVQDGPAVKILIVRHAQSANKGRARGEAANENPGLTDLGHEQAQALCKRLKKDLRPSLIRDRGVLVVCSPMRRCLLTILPTVQELGLPVEDCICHGGAYEYGAVGTTFAGTSPAEIAEEFPQFRPECFSAAGFWDYRGSNEREDQRDIKERAVRLVNYLHEEAAEILRSRDLSVAVRCTRTLLFVTHQTLQDLFCQVLVDGTDAKWVYGEVKHKLQNAGITEVTLDAEGIATFGAKNSGEHLLDLRFRKENSTASMR